MNCPEFFNINYRLIGAKYQGVIERYEMVYSPTSLIGARHPGYVQTTVIMRPSGRSPDKINPHKGPGNLSEKIGLWRDCLVQLSNQELMINPTIPPITAPASMAKVQFI